MRSVIGVRPVVCCVGLLALSACAWGDGPRERHVLILGIDGCRPDALAAADTPNIDGLIAQGAYVALAQAEDITISGPGWSSMLTGVHRFKHGVVDNSFAGSRIDQYPHFFQRLESVCEARTVSIANWAPINTQILRGRADVVLTGGPDDTVADRAVNALLTSTMDVLFVAFDEVDATGHAYGFDPSVPQYVAKIAQTDGRIGRILTALQSRPTYAGEDWLILLTADHGGTIDGSHGQNIPAHRTIPFLVSGPSSAVGTTITPAPELVDLPATVMTFLGVSIDPAWGWDGRAVGLNLAASPSHAFTCLPPPPPPVGACCRRDGTCVSVVSEECSAGRGVFAGVGVTCAARACVAQAIVFAENFEALVLGPSVSETPTGTSVWTSTPPAGWSVNNSGMPTGGVTEWRGWTFAQRVWWSQVAADQGRSGFTKGVGVVAVADPDEWDDASHAVGTFNSRLVTPAISLAGVKPQATSLQFDSSWLPEGLQRAEISASYDGGAPVIIADWRSANGTNYKAGNTNETVVMPLNAPASASSVRFTFSMLDAGNNWWWAIDNIEVVGEPRVTRRTLLSENFDGLTLGPSVSESPAGTNVWTPSPPAGWSVDNSQLPTGGQPEWRGWTFTSPAWWSQIAIDQGRSGFTKGRGVIAVADPDEWDDLAHAAGTYNSRLVTSPIPLGASRRGLELRFDSSWQPEGNQRAELVASFESATGASVGSPRTLIDWRSVQGATFKPAATNETVTLMFDAPSEAARVRFRFGLLDAGNNWWWAIDNLSLTAPACEADVDNSGAIEVQDIFAFLSLWFAGDARADLDGGGVNVSDIFAFLGLWFAGC